MLHIYIECFAKMSRKAAVFYSLRRVLVVKLLYFWKVQCDLGSQNGGLRSVKYLIFSLFQKFAFETAFDITENRQMGIYLLVLLLDQDYFSRFPISWPVLGLQNRFKYIIFVKYIIHFHKSFFCIFSVKLLMSEEVLTFGCSARFARVNLALDAEALTNSYYFSEFCTWNCFRFLEITFRFPGLILFLIEICWNM